jgi:DNA-binding MarR family transcriptional regulator
MLSKVLLAFAIEFERASELSLAISANVLRFADSEAVRVRDLPRLAGVSKESIAMAISFLERHGYAAVEAEAEGNRVKVLVLTAKGRAAQVKCGKLIGEIEERWSVRFGGDLEKLRGVLGKLSGEPDAKQSPLMAGLQPYPDCWRASVPAPETLPHFPMILHRGGFPDGS